ncbi:MAG: hypothetical protein HZA53_15210 [Planctomycetes bacterium]|nr:hypothetical protein [Planctomycetota bacterium]
MDLCIVENNPLAAGAPLLFALFAARRDAAIGATELLAFRLDPNGSWAPWPYPGQSANFVRFSSSDPVAGWPEANSAGTAVAADPADPNFVYVALGKGGLARVELTLPLFTVTKIKRPPCLFAPTCTDGESVRDIAIVSTATQGSFMYAASEYTGLLEYKIPPGTTPAATHPDHPSNWNAQTLSLPTAFAERVTAISTGGDYLFIAVATQTGSAIFNDTPAPFRNIGHWDGHCLAYGIPDPNFSPGSPVPFSSDSVTWFDRDAAVSAFNPVRRTNPSITVGKWWGSLLLRQRTPHDYRLYTCSMYDATSVRELQFPTSGPPPSASNPNLGAPIVTSGKHLDWGLAAGDGVVSELNPSVTLFSLDGPSTPGAPEGSMAFITPPPNEDIVVVPGSDSLCHPPLPKPAPPPAAGTGACGDGPNPYQGGLLTMAQWTDPVNPSREWFMAGDTLKEKYDQNCAGTDSCSSPCSTYWKDIQVGTPGQIAISSQGWRAVWMTPGNSTISSGAPTLPNPIRFWQFESPTIQPSTKSDSYPYLSSRALPDKDSLGYPLLLAAVRGGAESGLKLFRGKDIRPIALNSYCNFVGGGTGVGELLLQAGGYFPPWSEAITHPEFEIPPSSLGGPCYAWVACGGLNAGRPRMWNNTQCDFMIGHDQSGNPRWGCVVASGFVAAHPDAWTTERCQYCPNPPAGQTCPSNCITAGGPQNPGCQWDSYYGRALISVFDVHDAATGAGGVLASPVPVRYGIGPDQSFAWAVRTRYYPATGKTYAFVGDVLGKLLVFDVTVPFNVDSATGLAASPHVPYLPIPSGANYDLLLPVAVVQFPIDAADGYNNNCTDIELDESGQWTYCALGRGGVAVVNTEDPRQPQIQVILDTPGMATGLALRKNQFGVEQLVVGDGVCGIRLYGRTGTGTPP